jgi:hypothetical protein
MSIKKIFEGLGYRSVAEAGGVAQVVERPPRSVVESLHNLLDPQHQRKKIKK